MDARLGLCGYIFMAIYSRVLPEGVGLTRSYLPAQKPA